MIKKMLAVITAGGLAVAGCGSDDVSSQAVKGNGTDRAFAAAMIPHHESAVQMAAIASGRGESDFVIGLANNITETQTKEIALLRARDAELAKAGVKPGKLAVQRHMMGMDAGSVAEMCLGVLTAVGATVVAAAVGLTPWRWPLAPTSGEPRPDVPSRTIAQRVRAGPDLLIALCVFRC